ncbi:MAG: (2Fe-2S)-binding protein [Alphaproteobacteria bacterium]|nr:(2Fe-2S)-binding protein [Alphaproteobacteria bacterium]
MYVCNCNGITESQVKAALQAGAECWKDVHSHYDCAPKCGKCQCEIIDAIAEFQAEEPAYSDTIFAFPDLVGAT